MEKRPNLHIRGLSMDNVGQFERITIINMQMNAYLYCNPFEWETHTGYATLHTARATVIGMKARIEQRKKGERTRIFLLTLELREVAEWRGRRLSTTRPSHQENSCTLKCTQSTHTLDPGNYIFLIFFTPSSIKMHPISTSNFYLFISTSNFFFLFLFYFSSFSFP